VAEPKTIDSKVLTTKPSVAKIVDSKIDNVKVPQKKEGAFSIQVGVYSDPANVKQLQAKLKQTGFSSHTQKITTPKGEKIRLRAGSFASRQEANAAVPKLQKIGLSAMVVSND
jgi:DedD protein